MVSKYKKIFYKKIEVIIKKNKIEIEADSTKNKKNNLFFFSEVVIIKKEE
jgi:hypothetical protein